jgi:processive 1,2-diacylglycerol beta-glucosyltransferase
MSFPRVLVVSGSAGHGHVMAAEAVTAALRRRHPTLDVTHVDGVARMSRWYATTYRRGYVAMVDRAPGLWGLLYKATDRRTSTVGHALTVLGGRAFVRLVQAWKPHVVLCTHFLAPELLARAIRRGKLRTDLRVVVTDHDCHRVWWWPEVRRYYVASELVKARLVLRFGVPSGNVAVTGIPVRRGFGRRHDLTAVRARFGLDPGRPVVLFLSGGFAAGPMRRSILGLWMERRDIQVIAVCGRNGRLRRRVASLPRPAGAVLHAVGFVPDPSPLVAVADVVVAKSGGITVSECAAAGRPLLVASSIPGQEERNCDAILEAGAGFHTPTPEEVRWRVARLLEDPARMRKVVRAARAFGQPHAAAAIADAVAADVESPTPARPRFHGAP